MQVNLKTEDKDNEKNGQTDKIFAQSKAQEEFINTLYNEILKNFIREYLFLIDKFEFLFYFKDYILE